jgi:hypothetical protein
VSVETRKSRHGNVVTIRYRDKTGRQVRETLGLEAEGWTKSKAQKLERERIVKGKIKPVETWEFKRLADTWFDETAKRKSWKPLTLKAYKRSIVRLAFFHKKMVHEIERRLIRVTDSKTEEGIRSIAIPESLCLQLKEWCERG